MQHLVASSHQGAVLRDVENVRVMVETPAEGPVLVAAGDDETDSVLLHAGVDPGETGAIVLALVVQEGSVHVDGNQTNRFAMTSHAHNL